MTDKNNKPEAPKPESRERKKAAPSVPAAKPAANRPARPSSSATKIPPATGGKPETPAKPGIRPAAPGSRSQPPPATMSARALSRYEKDQRRQQWLIWATIGVVAFVILILAFGIWQTTIGPSFQTLGEVNGKTISRADYNKFRKNEIFKQSGRIQQAIQFQQGDQQQQLQSQLALLQDEVVNVADRPVNQTSLENYVGQIVLEDSAKSKFGISVSDQDVTNSLGDDFQSIVYTPTPNSSQSVQTATAGVAATQSSSFGTATAGAITPLPTPTPSVTVTATTGISGTVATGPLTPGPTPAGALTPGLTPAGTISATTTISATVAPTVTPPPTVTSTAIAADKVQQTASASQNSFLQSYRKFTSLSDDDYKRFEARPALIKKKVIEKLQEKQPKLGDPYPQTKVSHILVKEEAEARKIYDQLKAIPADKLESTFVQLARDKSTDTTTASHNGDLGWTTDKTPFDKDFLAAALKLEKGQFTEPVKTSFGFHIIYATDTDPKRPLDALTIQPFDQRDDNGDPQYFGDWLKAEVKTANAKFNTPPTPTPVPTLVPAPVFTPVLPPTSTPVPPTVPVAPAISPAAATTAATSPGDTTPAAATTVATPAATTAAAATPTVAATPAPSPTK